MFLLLAQRQQKKDAPGTATTAKQKTRPRNHSKEATTATNKTTLTPAQDVGRISREELRILGSGPTAHRLRALGFGSLGCGLYGFGGSSVRVSGFNPETPIANIP